MQLISFLVRYLFRYKIQHRYRNETAGTVLQYQPEEQSKQRLEQLQIKLDRSKKELVWLLAMNVLVFLLLVLDQGAAAWVLLVTIPASLLGALLYVYNKFRYVHEERKIR